jgi:hypothetical protein
MSNPMEIGTVVAKILDEIKAIAKERASDVLFIVGAAMIAFIYFVKFVSTPLTREPTTVEFVISVALAALLLFGGAALRILKDYLEIQQSIRAAGLLTDAASQAAQKLKSPKPLGGL